MTVSAAAVLAAMLAGPHYHADRGDSPEVRAELYRPVAQVIAEVSPDIETAAALIAHGEHETHWARYVIEARCSEGPAGSRCDPDRDGVARARGPFQAWKVACPKAWEHNEGSLASLREEARCVSRLLRWGHYRCGQSWLGAFSSTRGLRDCSWAGASARARTMSARLRVLYREVWASQAAERKVADR